MKKVPPNRTCDASFLPLESLVDFGRPSQLEIPIAMRPIIRVTLLASRSSFFLDRYDKVTLLIRNKRLCLNVAIKARADTWNPLDPRPPPWWLGPRLSKLKGRELSRLAVDAYAAAKVAIASEAYDDIVTMDELPWSYQETKDSKNYIFSEEKSLASALTISGPVAHHFLRALTALPKSELTVDLDFSRNLLK